MTHKSICVTRGQRACINCRHYRLYHCRGDGEIWTWMPTSHGCCLLHDQERGPLRQPCRNFEREGHHE